MKHLAIVILFLVLVYFGDQYFGWIGVAGAVGISAVAGLLLFRGAKHAGGSAGGSSTIE